MTTKVICVQEMRAFHAEAQLSIDKLQLDLASALEQFAQLAAYVNGAAKTSVSDPQAFYSMLLTFARDLDAAHRDNLAADEQVCFFCHASATTLCSLLSGRQANTTMSYSVVAGSESLSSRRHCTGWRQGANLVLSGRAELCSHCTAQARKRAKKAAGASKAPARGGAMPTVGSALKQRDRMLSQVKAYQRLRPEDRRALLTDKVNSCACSIWMSQPIVECHGVLGAAQREPCGFVHVMNTANVAQLSSNDGLGCGRAV